jgi:hypothetical protein
MCITYERETERGRQRDTDRKTEQYRESRERETDRQTERDVAPHNHQSRRFKKESVQCETYSRSKLLIKLIDDLKVHVLVISVIIII